MTGRGGLGLRKNKVNGELVDQKKQSGPTQPRDAEALEALGLGRDQAGGEAGPDTGGEDDFGRDSSHSDSDRGEISSSSISRKRRRLTRLVAPGEEGDGDAERQADVAGSSVSSSEVKVGDTAEKATGGEGDRGDEIDGREVGWESGSDGGEGRCKIDFEAVEAIGGVDVVQRDSQRYCLGRGLWEAAAAGNVSEVVGCAPSAHVYTCICMYSCGYASVSVCVLVVLSTCVFASVIVRVCWLCLPSIFVPRLPCSNATKLHANLASLLP